MRSIFILPAVFFALSCGTDLTQDKTTDDGDESTETASTSEIATDDLNGSDSLTDAEYNTEVRDTIDDDTDSTETESAIPSTDSATDTGSGIDTDETDSVSDTATLTVDSDVPGECAFLLVKETTQPCGGAPHRCEQWKKEGNSRHIRCSLPEFYMVDGELVAYTDDEFAQRKTCVMDWLENTLGATDLFQSTSVVGAMGNWNDIGVATQVAELKCRPVCSNDDCDYCYAMKNEADCSADAFCTACEETPVDVANDCREQTTRFAICRPFEYGCMDALGYFRDDETSECWQFSGLCDDRGFTEDATCRVTENAWCEQD